jgi:glycosyltransferase involved in cell wall biosynthesis/acetyltransferase-like isoleucine patch superfamily enzyme
MGGPRVGLVCGHFDPARDGVADYTRQLARHLRSAGLEPVICTARSYARSSAGTAEDRVVGVTERWNAGGVVRAAHELASLRLDVVHVQFAPSAYGFSRAVGLLPRLVPACTPVVATLHEYGVWAADGVAGRVRSAAWSAVERRRLADRETLLLVPRAARLLTTAPEHDRVLSARFAGGLAAVQVPVAPNILVSPIDPEHARAEARSVLGLPPDAVLAVFFGFLHPEKGLERLIEAVAQVRRAHPRLRLILAGGLESHSVLGAEAAALRRELGDVARRHGVADAVTFTGHLPEQDASRLLLSADVAVFPFNAGVTGKSGSLVAALAHGVPTIATSPPGASTRATEVEGVFRVPPRDTVALADALRRVLSDRALAARLIAAGRTAAASRTWPGIAAFHAEMYAEVLRRADRGGRGRERRAGGRVRPRGKDGTRMSLLERLAGQARRRGAAVLARRPRAGVPAGARDTEDPALFRPLVYGDPGRLHVHPTAVVNNAMFNLSSGEITVGEYAFFGHNVSVFTGTHDWTKFGAERQVAVPKSGRDVVIEEGAWVSSNAIIVGPCRIGAHSVVGVGSLVLRDVEPYSIVAGNPAKVLRQIPRPGEPAAAEVDPQAGTAGDVAAG